MRAFFRPLAGLLILAAPTLGGCSFRDADGWGLTNAGIVSDDLAEDEDFRRRVAKDPFPSANQSGLRIRAPESEE